MNRSSACAYAALALLALAPAVRAQPSPPQGPALPTQDFITTAAQTDDYERRAGRLAMHMGQRHDVREFGAMMVRDHTRTTAALKAAIRRSGLPAPPPPVLRPDQQQMLAQLRNAGRGFDLVYVDQQIKAHQAALSVMTAYAAGGGEAAIKAAAADTVPIVRRHLAMAERLQGAVH